MIGGSSDHDDGRDGLDRGLFSRIAVGYSKTLDNGLEINAQITDIVHQPAFYAPDVLYLSVGGGFGTITAGHHAMAACALMPRIVAMVPGGVNATWYNAFTGLGGSTWDDGSPDPCQRHVHRRHVLLDANWRVLRHPNDGRPQGHVEFRLPTWTRTRFSGWLVPMHCTGC